MKTTLKSTLTCIFATLFGCSIIYADDLTPTPDLPEDVVIDFQAHGSPRNVVIKLEGGRQIIITNASNSSVMLRSGDLNPIDSSILQNIIIHPGAGNVVRITTEVEDITLGELMKKDKELRDKK